MDSKEKLYTDFMRKKLIDHESKPDRIKALDEQMKQARLEIERLKLGSKVLKAYEEGRNNKRKKIEGLQSLSSLRLKIYEWSIKKPSQKDGFVILTKHKLLVFMFYKSSR
ncbi:hypothetical protein NBRC116592_04040 [Colwellia sp. KU-HH00111]|uniref:hypothetical protein n=1 Tax=Colwellia sp. KU-HH00111 TaxID=3127652 RepID=UPI003106EFC0